MASHRTKHTLGRRKFQRGPPAFDGRGRHPQFGGKGWLKGCSCEDHEPIPKGCMGDVDADNIEGCGSMCGGSACTEAWEVCGAEDSGVAAEGSACAAAENAGAADNAGAAVLLMGGWRCSSSAVMARNRSTAAASGNGAAVGAQAVSAESGRAYAMGKWRRLLASGPVSGRAGVGAANVGSKLWLGAADLLAGAVQTWPFLGMPHRPH